MLYKGRPQSISAHQPASSHETRSRRVVLSIQARSCWAFGMAMAAPGSPARPRQKATESRLIASPLRLPTAAGCLGSLYGTFGTICRPCRLIWSTPGGAGVHWLAGVRVCGCRGFRNPTVASITNGTDGAAWSVRGLLFFFCAAWETWDDLSRGNRRRRPPTAGACAGLKRRKIATPRQSLPLHRAPVYWR